MNLSFAGCGFLGIYHVGVAVCFKKYAPHLLLEKIGGASAGALAACCLLCDLPLGEMTSDFFRVVNEARSHSLGPFSPSFSIQNCLFEGLQRHLPDDAHKRVNGRLHISVTRVYDGKNVILSQFNSREDLLQALLCACFIPGFSGILPPRFHGVRYMDGAFSDNLPILDENTITVSPFCGESDICPRDESSQLFHLNWANTSIEISRQNCHRFVRILFPPKSEYLSKFCQQGFDDALQFLHRNNLINCRRCVAVQSTFVVSDSAIEDYDPECNECVKHRKDAMRGHMPQTVVDVIQGYLDQANKGLANWLFKHRGIKLISLPATVPADFVLAAVTKITRTVPVITKQVRLLIELIFDHVNEVVKDSLINRLNSGLIDMPEFDTATGIQASKHYGSRVSIMIDDHSNSRFIKESDFDTFDHILKVSTHQDAVYAYYYTDGSNKVNVTEIFDMTEEDMPKNLDEIFEGHVIDTHGNHYSTQPHQIYDVESQWNGVESDLFLDMGMNISGSESDLAKLDEDEDRNSSHSDYSDPEVDHYCMEQQTHNQRNRNMQFQENQQNDNKNFIPIPRQQHVTLKME